MSKSSVTAKPRSPKSAGRSKKNAKSARAPGSKALKTVASIARSPRIVAPLKAKLTERMISTQSPPVQPAAAASEIVLKSHKYNVGETVYFTSPSFGRAAATGSYTVVKLLPSEGDDYQYRIKSSGEAFERVAKESQLDRA